MAFLRTVVNLAIVAAASSTIVQPGAVGAPSAPAMRATTSNGAATLRLKGGEAEITDQTKISVFSKKDRLAITLSDFMRERCIDNKNDKDSRDLECIMNGVQAACRLIADMVGKAGIQDMTGLAGTGENVQGEEQKKLDILSNDVFKDKLAKTGCMAFLGSEEEDEAIHITGRHGGDYVAVFDPLDGSSNIDAAISVGTIFGIYKSNGAKSFPLLKGDQQVASGYCMYSTCSILMITLGDGVHGFTLDTSMGEFVLTHPNVKMPKRGKIYSTNQVRKLEFQNAQRLPNASSKGMMCQVGSRMGAERRKLAIPHLTAMHAQSRLAPTNSLWPLNFARSFPAGQLPPMVPGDQGVL